MEIIGNGAEAIIHRDMDEVIKERISKSYRLPEIDQVLITRRTKKEAKILQDLSLLNFPSPRLLDVTKNKIRMEFIKGDTLRDSLYKDPLGLGREMGRNVGILHKNDIIHGDLTTSNMILNSKVNFIDFGLSFNSNKIEDKAVDLHLLRHALESKHHTLWEACFGEVLNGYKSAFDQADEVINRLNIVELRGRNKH